MTDTHRAGPAPLWEWGALGLAAGTAALGPRPEGTLYTTLALLGLGLAHPPAPAGLVAGGGGAVQPPVAGSALFLWREFGVLSPSGWTQIGRAAYVLPNMTIVFTRDLRALRRGSGSAGAGHDRIAPGAGSSWRWRWWASCGCWRGYPALRFVPLALGANLAVDPDDAPDFAGDVMSPQTFLRHLSVLFPWLDPGAGPLPPPPDRGRRP